MLKSKENLAAESLLDLDVHNLLKLLESGQVSSSDAVEQYIQQIEKVNIAVNCVVEDRFSSAREEAIQADAARAEGKGEGKLFGIPISVKESFDVEGMATTGGLLRRRGFVQYEDAEVVEKLRAEGAIILGKTNTPELCFCQETDNKLYGRTNNPHDLTRTAGGSSGGEGAMIAAGCAAIGIGSDIGGSIRFPSHFNGVVGFKSGKGKVSQMGSYPFVEEPLQQRMLGIGPIARTVRDARLLYDIIAYEPIPEKTLDRFTVNVFRTTDYPLSTETTKLLNEVYLYLREEITSEREPIPFFDDAAQVWQEIMSIDGGTSNAREAYGDAPATPIRSYITEKRRGTGEIHQYLSWALFGASLFRPSPKRIYQINEYLENGDIELDLYLDNRILVLPIYHCAAPKHGIVYKEIFSIRKTFKKYLPYVAYANTWGLPSLTIPLGKDADGMPIGLQLISKNGNEDVLFQLGEKLESRFPGYERARV
ncbi:fatty acid amide hydrolase 2 [Sporosarcina luteola]|nr:fatty acid amide hydrolase 2 [Sporosarcina luteola]